MAKKTIATLVTITVNDDEISPAGLRAYILAAVQDMRGSFHPSDPLFRLPRGAFKVRAARLT